MTLDEMIESIESVTRDEVQMIANEFFQTENIALAMLGRIGEQKIGREDLVC
jgi:predicted Zn-dependent peptidase